MEDATLQQQKRAQLPRIIATDQRTHRPRVATALLSIQQTAATQHLMGGKGGQRESIEESAKTQLG